MTETDGTVQWMQLNTTAADRIAVMEFLLIQAVEEN